jgi:RNA polymerase sigma factor (sigma-70 family)
MSRRTKPDTLARIVREARKKEEKINQHHPERNGYGFIDGEADEYIRRIERLEAIEERAQQAKILRRIARVSLMSNDVGYSRSPEDIYIENETRSELSHKIDKVTENLHPRNKEIVSMYYGENYTQKELADKFDLNQSTISRVIANGTKKIENSIDEESGSD